MASLLAAPYRGGTIIPKARFRIGGCPLNLTVSQCMAKMLLSKSPVQLGFFVSLLVLLYQRPVIVLTKKPSCTGDFDNNILAIH